MKTICVPVLVLFAVFACACDAPPDESDDVMIVVPDGGTPDVAGDVAAPEDVGPDFADDVSAVDDDGAPDATDAQTQEDVEGDSFEADEGQPHDTNEVTVPSCFAGQDECLPTTIGDRQTWATAEIIGRARLQPSVNLSPNTMLPLDNDTPKNNDHDLSDKDCPWIVKDSDPLWCQSECSDSGPDHFYRVFLIPGDLLSISVSDILVYDKFGTNIDFMIKVFKGYSSVPVREDLLSCTDDRSSGRNNVEVVQLKPMTEAEAGWHTIVIDSPGDDHAGTYSISFTLFQNSEYTGDWSLCCDFPPI